MAKKIKVGKKSYVAKSTKDRTINGVLIPKGVDLSKRYNIHSAEAVQEYRNWQAYEEEGSADFTAEEFRFFEAMWCYKDLYMITSGRWSENKSPINCNGASYITAGEIDGIGYAIVCALPILWDTGY